MRVSSQRKYLFFIIYFIVRYHMTMENWNLNWNWYVVASNVPQFFAYTSRRGLHKFTPIWQNMKPQMSETRIFETLLSCFASKANASKLNKFIFVFLKFATEFAAEMSWHWKRIAVFSQLDNNWDELFSTEIQRLSPVFLAAQKFTAWFMELERCSCWKFMTKWTGNMKSYRVNFSRV